MHYADVLGDVQVVVDWTEGNLMFEFSGFLLCEWLQMPKNFMVGFHLQILDVAVHL